MSKNIIWILVIGFILGFISYEQLSNFSAFDTVKINWEMVSALGSILAAIAMFYTIRKMSEQNKISADSVNEMKKQYEDNIYQKDTEIYRKYSLEITKEWSDFIKTYKENEVANNVIIILKNLDTRITQCLFELSFRSVYREELQKLSLKTNYYIDNINKTELKEITIFIQEIVKILAKIQNYIKPES